MLVSSGCGLGTSSSYLRYLGYYFVHILRTYSGESGTIVQRSTDPVGRYLYPVHYL